MRPATAGSAIAAQVEAEVRTRLRTTGSAAAAVALFVLSFLWIPDPASRASSITWKDGRGAYLSGIYNSAYVGASSAIVCSLFLSLFGFYLVSGSLQRDARRGVGLVVAAAPISSLAYLLGHYAAQVLYLAVLAGLALASGLVVFLRYGVGALSPPAFLLPYLLLVAPCLVVAAALAVLFDVTPGLKGRGGKVAYFFVWMLLFGGLPLALGRGDSLPLYDPAGVLTFVRLLQRSVPDLVPDSLSIGLQVSSTPPVRVPWSGLPYSWSLLAARTTSLLWALPPLALAVRLFDRFDPARRGPLVLGREEAVAGGDDAPAPPRSPSALTPAHPAPSALGGVLAEARLVWRLGSQLRWPLLIAAAVAVLPGPIGRVGAGAFLLLLGPVLSECAAREPLHGTSALVFSQPGVPGSRVLWKAAAVLVFVLAVGLPWILSTALSSPARSFAAFTGLVFVAAMAVAVGHLSGGGRLFLGAYTALWYAAVSGAGPLDYAGAFGGGTGLGTRAAYLLLAAGALALAAVVERRR